MWLLNACSWEMKDFLSQNETPPYAILSHTWGDEEVSFRDWHSEPWFQVQKKQGYGKIKSCCEQAIAEGLEWVWNKSSSAELSEAINSMFQWYANAVICYAYLSDVDQAATEDKFTSSLASCRWITRGWTLQELIAPPVVVFYSKDWHACGTRSQLSAALAAITLIDEPYLTGRPLRHASVAQRMSWASVKTVKYI
ncbi:HET-domain-containing protein [Xylaria venustula]|nr:HET-domain-containing protein [Xylaria venustula]